ncbi:MAG: hypothetical protein KDJ37_08725 [Hyphomicrobiaceae bacterium]|nr:hypothetical protein [Hyphomicrobiaceae bacterium]
MGHASFDAKSEQLRLGPQERVAAWRLAERRPIFLAEMIRAFYSNDVGGGAEYAGSVVRHVIFRLRKKLAPHGIDIRNEYGRGWRVPQSQQARLLDVLAAEVDRNAPSAADILRQRAVTLHSDREEMRP